MRLIKGLRETEARKIEEAVAGSANPQAGFASIEALWRASGVKVATLRKLAAADAFGSMGLDRQQALWHIRELRDEHLPLFQDGPASPPAPAALPTVPETTHVNLDYGTVGLTLRQHPMSFLRPGLEKARITPCSVLKDEAHWPTGQWIRVAGIVLVRQRPGTASGVVFMTLEDETGVANLIVRPHIYTRFRSAARHATILLAHGRVERQGQVVHVLVSRLEDLGPRATVPAKSRDFH